MPNLKQLIDELDELAAKVNKDSWDEYHRFLIALSDNYEALRRAALAGEALAEAVEEMEVGDNVLMTGKKIDTRTIWIHLQTLWRQQRDSALSAYRQALEEDKK